MPLMLAAGLNGVLASYGKLIGTDKYLSPLRNIR